MPLNTDNAPHLMPEGSRLKIVSEPFRDGKNQICVRVLCDCGTELKAVKSKVLNGNTRSCGCLKRDTFRGIITKHGLSKHPLCVRYWDMVARCENENNPSYKDYGGRGIRICDRWRQSFENYLKDVGEPPFPGAELDRIDNNKGYEPGNVQWATDLQQNNNSRKCRKITHKGETLSLRQWCERLGYCHASLRYRLDNMPLEAALQPNCGFKTWKQRNLRKR